MQGRKKVKATLVSTRILDNILVKQTIYLGSIRNILTTEGSNHKEYKRSHCNSYRSRSYNSRVHRVGEFAIF